MRTILLVLLFPALGLAQVDLSSSAQVKNVLRVGNGGTGSATFGAFTLFGNNTNATAAPTIVGMDSLFGSCSGANSALTYNTSTHAFGCNTITPGTGTVTSIVFSSPLTGGTITTTGSVGITQATTSTDGYLSSTDWNTFNGKQAAGSYALQSTTLTASSPLTGGGDLSTNRAFGCQAASGAQAGCLSSTDWSTFNGKQAALSSTTAVAHQYLTAFTAPNTFSQAQPVCADLSDSSGGCTMSTTAGGDLSGTLPSPTVAKVNGSTPGGTCTAQFVRSLNSSAVPTCDSIVGADLPAPTSSAPGALPSVPYWMTPNAMAGAGGTTTQNKIHLTPFYLPIYVTPETSFLMYRAVTADNSSNSYDLGWYGPGCYNGASNVPLALHIGTTAGSTVAPSGSVTHRIALTGSAGTLIPGWYCFAFTSNAASPTFAPGADTAQGVMLPFNAASTITGGGNTLPSTITAPVISWSAQAPIWTGLN